MAVGANITRNGKAYDGGDVRFFIEGVEYYGVSAMTYGNSQEHQLNFSGKTKATSWSIGKTTPSCTMTIDMADVVELERRFGKDLTKVKPFIATAQFGDEYNAVITDRITMKFMDHGRDATGEMNLQQQFTMFALSVDLNV